MLNRKVIVLSTICFALTSPLVLATGPAFVTADEPVKVKPKKKTPTKAVKSKSDSLNSRIQINGFLSAGMMRTNSSASYNIPGHGSLDNKFNFAPNSLVGLQITGHIDDKLSAVTQFVANGDNRNGNQSYRINAEWAYLRYEPTSYLQVRAGRFRLPLFIYSETQEVGYSYPWIFLPNEVYRIVPFNNINGVSAIYTEDLGQSGWVFKFQPFFGQNTSQFDLYTNQPSVITPGTTATFQENNLYGAVASVGNPYFTMRGTYAHVDLTAKAPIAGQPTELFKNQSTSFYSAGAKFDYDNFIAVAEYAHRETPNQITSLTGYYGMVGYHLGKLLPNFTYARMYTTNTAKLAPVSELPESQDSYTLGLDYFVNHNLVVKANVSEVNPLDGTNGLFNKPAGKHVLMYGLSLDVVF